MMKGIRVAIAFALGLTASGCFNLGGGSVSFRSGSVSALTQWAYPPGSTAGIKTVAQLGPSVAAVTNVSLSGVLMPNYNIIASWLSVDGSATSMNSSMLMAITQFMAVACKQMITNDASLADGSRWADNGVNYGAGPTGLVSGSGSSMKLIRSASNGKPSPGAAAIDQYTSRFWRRPATDDEFNVFSTALINAVKDSSNFTIGTSPQDQTIGVLLVPCTMALSSTAFLLN